MSDLIKIRDVSIKYDITARTLRYYENMGLINSIRTDDSSYRLYDVDSIKRLEQILILRKLNISIKDIKRILDSKGSNIVLDVLNKKVDNIDDEVTLLHELKDILLEFIHEIEKVDFEENSSIRKLYDKAKEIETEITKVDYNGKSASVSRLLTVTEKLDKKVPDVMVIRVPKFKALSSGDHIWEDIFKYGGIMFQMWRYHHFFKPILFDCLDFTLAKGDIAEMICSIKDGVSENDVYPFKLIDFEGGLYAMSVSIDDDDESIDKVHRKIMAWLETTNFELDKKRHFMFNMPYLDEENGHNSDIEKGLGYKQMQRYVPIKLKKGI